MGHLVSAQILAEVKRALTHHLSRAFGAGKLTNHNHL